MPYRVGSPFCAVAAAFALTLSLSTASPSRASENTSVAAQLSWSATNASSTNLTSPGSLNKLYVILKHGVTNYRGAEIDIHWDPPGDVETGCVAHILTEFKTSTGTVVHLS